MDFLSWRELSGSVHASPLPRSFSSFVDLEASVKERGGFYSWEMESVSESSQQQKRKLVTHGLEDQKRVSGRTFLSLGLWHWSC